MTRGTVIMGVLALLSFAGAMSMRPVPMAPPTFEDTGEALFPDFVDPNAATFLEVKDFDEESAQLTSFSVKLDDGKWVIPSHNDYPADGTEQMGKAAASFIGVNKDVVRSDDPKDHAEFGVVDPEDEAAAEGTRGRRVTIKDASGTNLADVIIGKDVPERPGFKFVRYPGENRVYAVELDPQVSTKFTDWIEDDLLKMESDDIVAVLSNSYSVVEASDEATGEKKTTLEDDNPIYFELSDSGAFGEDGQPSTEWAVAAPPVFGPEGERIDPETWEGEEPLPAPVLAPEGKELNPTKVKQIVGASDRMKIVGVRPRAARLDPFEMRSKGFFLVGEPPRLSLLGNEGEVHLFSNDGVVYTLFFGEVTYATGEALSAGGEDAEPDEQAENARANRYMFVNVGYDPRRDQNPGEPSLDGEPRGQERAEMLAKRFERWYYVIPDSSFTQVHKVPDDFWRDIKE
ncbi:hypothetical protein ENSA5_34450 [Enhygromyxa salina]|uniref:DUF4340 domain-containing protein n=1 Tax=Enhygromyxa salina TaxID=215803 RepID=A0A2S9XX79_9BACT|nr:DUF4340 domain-containing protein [Enhygromyxa salina]PRP97453.1 hypothetical protein ENSA5_34450 [Enhygromyxa salina]